MNKTIISFLIFFCLALGLGYNTSRVSAQPETVPIICEDTAFLSSSGLWKNKLEIPIGRTTDQAEYLADLISEEMEILITQAGVLTKASNQLSVKVNQCNDDQCQSECKQECNGCSSKDCGSREENPTICNQECNNCPNNKLCCCDVEKVTGGTPIGCEGCSYVGCDSSKWTNPSLCWEECMNYGSNKLCCCSIVCEPQPCEGEACPAGIQSAMDTIKNTVVTMETSKNKISGHYITGGYYVPGYYDKIKDDIVPKLRTSRDRFAGCATRPDEAAKLFEGEAIGKQLFDCKTILNSFIPVNTVYPKKTIPTKSCYGNTYCQYLDNENKDLPYPGEACAEDYFCCFLGQ